MNNAGQIMTLAGKGFDDVVTCILSIVVQTAPKFAKEAYRNKQYIEKQVKALAGKLAEMKKNQDVNAFQDLLPPDVIITELYVETGEPVTEILTALVVLADFYRIIGIRASQLRAGAQVFDQIKQDITNLVDQYNLLIEKINAAKGLPLKWFAPIKQHGKLIAELNRLKDNLIRHELN